MSTSSICLACRRQISARIRLGTSRQWRSASTFVSLGNIGKVDGKAKVEHVPTGDATKPHSAKLSRKKQHVSPSKRPGDFLEFLFTESLQPIPPLPEDSAPPIGTTARTYEDIEIFKEMVISCKHHKDDIRPAWDFLVSNFGPESQHVALSLSAPASLGPVAGTLLKWLVEERKRNAVGNELPNVTEICQLYRFLGFLKHDMWNILVLDLLDKLASTIKDNGLSSSSEMHTDTDAIITDLLGAWRELGRMIRHEDGAPLQPQRQDWDFLKPRMATRHATPAATKQARRHMRELLESNSKTGSLEFLDRVPRHENRDKSVMALVTFAVMMDCSAVRGMYKKSGFVSHVKETLSIHSVNVKQLSHLPFSALQPIEPTTLGKLDIDWSKVQSLLVQLPETSKHIGNSARETAPEGKRNRSPGGDLEDSAAEFLGAKRSPKLGSVQIHQKLANALHKKNVNSVDSLWQEVQDQLTAEICNRFILTYASLRYPNSAIDVWNHMVKIAIYPNVSTWNAMLEGCRVARSPEALEGVWRKLIASGATPDSVCWTTRINGLADCYRPREAVQALEEMGRIWIQEARSKKIKDIKNAGDIGIIVKPTTSVINAAIHGLIRYKHNEDANRVLAWAAQLGIKPDIITFNILLTPLVRQGRTAAVQAILGHMQTLGIEADITTFTTVLDEIIRDNFSLPPETQIKAISDVLDQMAAAGVPATIRTYSKIVYDVLNPPLTIAPDLSVASAVLARMSKDGLEPGAHIHTMLINHYFSLSPPDMEAVRSLVEQIHLENRVVDNIFWDRVIEGYSREGYTTAALALYGQVDKESSRVGWGTLTVLVGSLVGNGEQRKAIDVVRNVKMERGGPIAREVKGANYQHTFWDLVEEYNLDE